jgi:hypothetical protein
MLLLLLRSAPPIQVVDTVNPIADITVAAVSISVTLIDSVASVSDAASASSSHVTISDTLASISDSTSVTLSSSASATDTLATISDLTITSTNHPEIVDTLAAISDTTTVSTNHPNLTDTIAVISDSPSTSFSFIVHPTSAIDIGSLNQPGAIGSGVATGVPGLVIGDTDTSFSLPGVNSSAGTVGVPRLVNTLEPAQSVSFGCVFELGSIPPASATLRYTVFGYGADGAGNNSPYKLHILSDGVSPWVQATVNTSLGAYSARSATISLGKPYHAIATFDGFVVRLYLNNVLTTATVSTTTAAQLVGYNTVNGLRIGASDDFSELPFNGIVSNVVVFAGNVLSQTRISAHYAAFIGSTAYEVQRATLFSGSTINQTLSLSKPPISGNTLILVAMGYPNDTPPTGFTPLGYYDGAVNNVVAWTRQVQSGDGLSYTFTASTDFDDGALLIEFSGAITSIVLSAIDQTYTAGPNSMPSSSVAVQNGSYVYSFFAPALTSATYTPSGTSLSNGFLIDSESSSQQSTRGSSFLFGHKIFSGPGTATTTAAFPALAISSGPQLQVMLAITTASSAVDIVSAADTRAAFSDTPAVTDNHATDFVYPTDTRASSSDAPAMGITRNLTANDVRDLISDSAVVIDTHTGGHALLPIDTRDPTSDTPAIVDSAATNVSVVQRTDVFPGAVASFTASLLAPPTPGNLLVFVVIGSPNSALPTYSTTNPNPVGWTQLVYDNFTTVDDLGIWARYAQAGDSASVTIGTAATWDDGASFIEFANASMPVAWSQGDATYTSGTHTIASGTISAQAGAYVLAMFGLHGAISYVPGSTTLSGGFAIDVNQYASGTPNPSLILGGHLIVATAQSVQTTATIPSESISSGAQTYLIIAIPLQAKRNVIPSDTRGSFSDTPAFTHARPITVTDTAVTNTDFPTIGLQHNIAANDPLDARTPFSDAAFLSKAVVGQRSVSPIDVRPSISDVPTISRTHNVAVTDTGSGGTDLPAILQSPGVPPPIPVRARSPRILIFDKRNVLMDIPSDVVNVSATTIVNGGSSDCSLQMPRKFADIGAIGEGFRIQIFLPDDYVTPWWDGRATEVDFKSTWIGGQITVNGEGWETQLNDDIATFWVTPGVQSGGVDNGQIDYAVFVAWLLQTYAAPGYTVVIPQHAGINLNSMQAQHQGLADVLNTVTQSILDASGSHWEWFVDGQPNLGKQILVQPISINESVPIALDKNADCNNYDVLATYRNIHNMLALYGGTDASTGVQVWSPYSDSVSIALYGLRQYSLANSYLVTQAQLNQYAVAQLDVAAYPVFTGSWQMKIATAAIRAGKWVQVFEPELKGLRTMRIVRCTVSWSAGAYIVQTCEPNAPLPNIDRAIYDTSASSRATGASLAAISPSSANLRGTASVVGGGGILSST